MMKMWTWPSSANFFVKDETEEEGYLGAYFGEPAANTGGRASS